MTLVADQDQQLEIPATHSRRSSFIPYLLLLLITAFGGLIRFSFLHRPCLWGDEANVYLRSVGKYSDMLAQIRDQGFGPLHYELAWLLQRNFRMTPVVMRFNPALCGTLMIPAMYFLARQLLQRSTSLVVAAFTACSAFLIFYSRDAKMYSDTWLFLVLSSGSLFWWFRRETLTAWLCWVAAGCLAAGIHSTGMGALAISPLFLLTQRRMHWKKAVLWLLGLLLIISGPVGYYTKFNKWNTNVEARGWNASGIEWVENFNEGRDGPGLIHSTGTSFLMGWTWPRIDDQEHVTPVLLSAPALCADLLLAIFIAALLPWPFSERPDRLADIPPEPQWRLLLWLGVWVVIPSYICFCHSMPTTFISPMRWGTPVIETFPKLCSWIAGHHWSWYVFGTIAVAAAVASGLVYPQSKSAMLRGLQCIIVAAIIFAACVAVFRASDSAALMARLAGRPWKSIWMPRYLGFTWPALAMATATLLMRLPTRPIRICAIGFLLAVNLAFGAMRIFGGTEPPVEQIAADVFAAEHDPSVRTYCELRYNNPTPANGSLFTMPGRYYLQVLDWKPPMSVAKMMGSLAGFRTSNFATIPDDLKRETAVNRLVTWKDFDPKIVRTTDTVAVRLKGWKLTREDWYLVRSYWDLQSNARYCRREYIKITASAAPLPNHAH